MFPTLSDILKENKDEIPEMELKVLGGIDRGVT